MRTATAHVTITGMAHSSTLGPVELTVLTFPGTRIDADVKAGLAAVVDQGYVTLLDLIYLAKDANGYLTQVEIDESLEAIGLDGLAVDARGLVSDDDLELVRSSMAPDTSAVVLVYEQTWARALAGTVSAAGGEVQLHVQVPRDALDAALVES